MLNQLAPQREIEETQLTTQTLHSNFMEEKDEELSVSQRRKDYFS